MLLKRSIILSAGVLLFILAFFLYFQIANAQMESRFRQERQKFGVDGMTLTANPSPLSTDIPSPGTRSPPATHAPAPVSSDAATIDTNILIGPVPPPSSATPDTAPVPSTAPAAPDPNSAPMAPPPSTLNLPRENHSSFFVLTAYGTHASDGMPDSSRRRARSRSRITTPAAATLAHHQSLNEHPEFRHRNHNRRDQYRHGSRPAGTNTAPYAVSGNSDQQARRVPQPWNPA